MSVSLLSSLAPCLKFHPHVSLWSFITWPHSNKLYKNGPQRFNTADTETPYSSPSCDNSCTTLIFWKRNKFLIILQAQEEAFESKEEEEEGEEEDELGYGEDYTKLTENQVVEQTFQNLSRILN